MMKADGIAHVTLTVVDLQETKTFYETLFETSFQLDNDWSFSLLKVGIPCWFVQWKKKSENDTFDEKRTGLDHVAFKLESQEKLDHFIKRLNEMGVKNAGLEHFAGKYPYVAFRDPSNIQTEFFIPKPI